MATVCKRGLKKTLSPSATIDWDGVINIDFVLAVYEQVFDVLVVEVDFRLSQWLFPSALLHEKKNPEGRQQRFFFYLGLSSGCRALKSWQEREQEARH